MRATLLLLALTTINVLTAQVNIGGMMPKPGSSKGVSVEDDNDPFVPNTFIGSFRMENHLFKNGEEEKDSPTNMRYWSTPERTMTKVEMPDAKGRGHAHAHGPEGQVAVHDDGGREGQEDRHEVQEEEDHHAG
ncbi:MAG: hypothetical protein IPN85_12675 [Flavobacteriales bacterium]|nr:hypothetical protein [Flavobacteriales bacterium]